MDEEKLKILIENIYGAAFEQDGLERLSQMLRVEFRASHVAIIAYSCAEKAMVFVTGTTNDTSCTSKYLSHYHKLESILPVYQNNPQALRPLSTFPIQAFFDPKAHLQSDFYNDFQRHYDLCLPLNSMLDIPGFDFTHFLVDRPLSTKAFGDEEIELLTALTPHLNRGLRLYFELAELRAKTTLFETAFDSLGATFLLDAMGKVLALNAKAEEILNGGSALTVCDDRLAARHPPDDARLAASLRPPHPGAPPADIVLRGPSYCPDVRLTITPVNGGGTPFFSEVTHTARAAFLVTAVPLGPSTQNLMAQYALTRAEAEVAMLLCEGLRAAQIATHRETSVGTVNTQLKNIYSKTGVDGHAGLLVKLLGR